MKKVNTLQKLAVMLLGMCLTVTGFSQTFSSSPGSFISSTNPNGQTDDVITVAGVAGTLGTDVFLTDVVIDIEHTWVGDLEITLTGPGGTPPNQNQAIAAGQNRIYLVENEGGTGDNFDNTQLSDFATQCIGNSGAAPYAGFFKPEGSNNENCATVTFASAFDGMSPNGDWLLRIDDEFGGDDGTLNSWSISFGAPCDPPLACPADMTVANTTGDCGAVVNFTIDDSGCGGLTAVADPPSGSLFPVGSTTTVEVTAGLLNSCSFNITVGPDTEDPTINCPSDITLNLAAGECSTFYSYGVTFDDNCPLIGPTGTLATLNAANNFGNVGNAVYFDVENISGFDLTITEIGVRISANSMVEIYLTPGTSNGNQTNAGAWTLVGMADATTGAVAGPGFGSNVITPAPTDFVLPTGSWGIAIVAPSASQQYTNGNGGNQSYSDASLELNLGSATNVPFTGFAFQPRVWNGYITYAAPASDPEQTMGLPSGSEFPIGVTTNCFEIEDQAGNIGSCCFNVTVNEFPNATQSLACNDNVQISLDQDCSATVGADMILEGGPYGCYDSRYTVMVLSPTGANLGNVVGASFIGSTWTVKVVDNNTQQSCWGSIVVEDKLAPTIECRNLTIACTDELPVEPAPSFTGPLTMVEENIGEPLGEAGAPVPDVHSYDFDYSFYPPGTPVQDVDVIVTLIEHTWLPDLDIVVETPGGASVDVFAVTGCFGAEFDIDVIFDDEGLGGVTQCAQLDAGGARLQGFQAPGVQSPTILEALDGEDASGTWTLTFRDNFGGDDGIIINAGLIVTAEAPAVAPTDNCGPVTVDIVESFSDDNCGGPAGTVTRTWTVTDASGNSASCNQTITYERPTLDDVEVPADIKWTCEQYNAYPNIVEATPRHPYITDTDLGTAIIDVNLDPNCDDQDFENAFQTQDAPSVNSTNTANGGNGCPGAAITSKAAPGPNSGLDDADVLELTGSGVPRVNDRPLEGICEIETEYEDLLVEVCPGTFKIIRKWTLIDWCADPVDVREINQVIKVVDEIGPSINAPADLTINVYAASVPQNAGPHASCQGTFNVPPAAGISDNCSGVTSFTTELWTIVGGAPGVILGTVNSNGGVFSGIPLFNNGLPAQYIIRYYATDGCGNQSFDDTFATLRDKVPPVAICDEITEVSITNNGLNTGESCSTLYAEDLDDGSYDNCTPVYFLIAKMDDSFSPTIFNRCYYPSRDFCCEDIGDNTVILLVLDQDPTPFFTTLNSPSLGCDGTPGLFLPQSFSAINYNTCMVTVQVTDKLPPILISCPGNTRRTCDWYAQNLETQLANAADEDEQCDILTGFFGEASFFDNCALDVNCDVTINVDQCLEGFVRRTWSATDDYGNPSTQNCTQQIFIDHVSDWVVEFPEDKTIDCGTTVPDFGEPEIFFETCELVAVSFEDEVFTTVPDACYKILRTWTVINWCVVGEEIDQEIVEQSEHDLWTIFGGCLGGPNSPEPNCDLDNDGDCDEMTYRDTWNCQTIADGIITVDPTHNVAPFDTDDDPVNDSDPWDGYITYQQVIKVVDDVDPVFTDGCEIPDVCIGDNTCSATVLLPTPDIDECSEDVTINAQIRIGGVWLNGFGPYLNVAPGTYDVRYVAIDNCNNQTACETSVTVVDCKKPTPYCKNGIIVELMVPVNQGDEAMVEVWAVDLNDNSFDNCPGALKFSFSANVNDIGRTFTCDDLGQQAVELWVTDAAGNQDFCETFVIIQANMGQCDDDPMIAGATATEDGEGVEDVNININSPSGFNADLTTDAAGAFNANVPAGGDYTITPVYDENPLNGVSTFDLVLISKHILGVQTLDSPYKIIAADANKSNSVTTFDLVEIRKLILFINTDFPNNTSWRFVDANYNFANPANPFSAQIPEVINFNNLTADALASDFVAVKVGDVNGNAATFAGVSGDERSFVGDLVLNTEDAILEEGQIYTVEFKATDFNVSGYQFTLNFNENALEFVDVVPGLAKAANFGMTMVNEGVLTTSWNSDEAKQLTAGDVVFGLTFTAKQSGRLSDMISLNSRYTTAEAYNTDNQLLNVALSFNNSVVANGFELYQNTPNPFATTTAIGFYLPEATSATLTISDVQGKVVKVIDVDAAKGYNQVELKRSDLGANGVLYYRLDTDNDSATRKMILVD